MGVFQIKVTENHKLFTNLMHSHIYTIMNLELSTCRYALFYLLREVGTFTGSIGAFVDLVRQAVTPEEQMRIVNAYRPLQVCHKCL